MRIRDDSDNVALLPSLLPNEKKNFDKPAKEKWERNADRTIGERQKK